MNTYTDKELLDRVKSLPSFKGLPIGYWILGVRSAADKPDEFDDKFYLFKSNKFILYTFGTTNPGKYGLQNFKDYNKQGCAVLKADEWHHDIWANGKHKGKMDALVQVNPAKYYRDNDGDLQSEEIGRVYSDIIGLNFHTASYLSKSLVQKFIAKLIGKWSVGCQVVSSGYDYYRIIDYVCKQRRISYCLLKEF